METQAAIDYLNELNHQLHNQPLNPLEQEIIRAAIEKRQYKDIPNISQSNVSKAAQQLFQRLSQDFGTPINKSKLSLHLNSLSPQQHLPSRATASFYGRAKELKAIEEILEKSQSNLVTISGIGGIGKTSLVRQYLSIHRAKYQRVIWISLREAPSLPDSLLEIVKQATDQSDCVLSPDSSIAIFQTLDQLKKHPYLLVFDNAESILEPDNQYREGYSGYRELWHWLSLTENQTHTLITTRTALTLDHQTPIKLTGLDRLSAQQQLRSLGLGGSNEQLTQVIQKYAANPLALKIIPNIINDIFAGDINHFLQSAHLNYPQIEAVLAEQCDRLDDYALATLYWLAIERQPVSIQSLQANAIYDPSLIQKLPQSLDLLVRRNLVELEQGQFTLQNVILEYITHIIQDIAVEEIRAKKFSLLRSHSLLQAEAKEYIRENQRRMILQPIIDKLQRLAAQDLPAISRSNARAIELLFPRSAATQATAIQNLRETITALRHTAQNPQLVGSTELNYAAGNIINLLVTMNADLTDYDFSNLYISQAYLQGVKLPNVNFSRAEFDRCILSKSIGSILALAFSPDLQTLATAGTDSIIRLWAVDSGQEIAQLTGHTGWIRSINFSEDGRFLVSGSADRTVRLWSIAKRQCLRVLSGHQDQVWAARFFAKDSSIISASGDNKARIWPLGRNLPIEFSSPEKIVAGVAIHKFKVASSIIEAIKIWDLFSKKQTGLITADAQQIRALAFSPDGKILAGAGHDRQIRIWEVATGKLLHKLIGHQKQIWSLSFTESGEYLVSGSANLVRLWDWRNQSTFRSFADQSHRIRSIAVAQRDRRSLLAIGSDDGLIKLWDIQADKLLKTIKNYANRAWCVAHSPDGRFLVSGSDDGMVRLWLTPGTAPQELVGHLRRVRTLAISPNSQLIASGSHDGTIRIWRPDGTLVATLEQHLDWLVYLEFMDNSTLISIGDDQTIYRWDLDSGNARLLMASYQEWYWGFAIIKNHPADQPQQLLALAGNSKVVEFLNINSGELISTNYQHDRPIRCLAYNNHRQQLASIEENGILKIWDLQSDQLLQEFPALDDIIRTICWHPFSPICALAGDRGTIFICNILNLAVNSLKAHLAPIWSLSFHPNGENLISCSEDESIVTWQWSTALSPAIYDISQPYVLSKNRAY
jgi:WD40 repeat protein